MSNIYHTKWIYNHLKDKYGMKENIIQEFRLKNIDETRHYWRNKPKCIDE